MGIPARLASLARLPAGFFEARSIVARHRARGVVGMGGYVTVPVLAAARSLSIPTVVHDSSALPGIATKFANRFATKTALGLAAANSRLKPGTVTGTPVREEFFRIPALSPSAPTRRLLVFGGSQGSIVLNRDGAGGPSSRRGGSRGDPPDRRSIRLVQAAYGEIPARWKLLPFLPVSSRSCRGPTSSPVRRHDARRAGGRAAAVLVPFGSATTATSENAAALVEAGAARMIRRPR
jgi:UDP-N-acetylglucosamine:LPS N-acetylglucosamine transferase